jgi:hypothetical protein
MMHRIAIELIARDQIRARRRKRFATPIQLY